MSVGLTTALKFFLFPLPLYGDALLGSDSHPSSGVPLGVSRCIYAAVPSPAVFPKQLPHPQGGLCGHEAPAAVLSPSPGSPRSFLRPWTAAFWTLADGGVGEQCPLMSGLRRSAQCGRGSRVVSPPPRFAPSCSAEPYTLVCVYLPASARSPSVHIPLAGETCRPSSVLLLGAPVCKDFLESFSRVVALQFVQGSLCP